MRRRLVGEREEDEEDVVDIADCSVSMKGADECVCAAEEGDPEIEADV